MKTVITLLFLSFINAQIALPTFQSVHKPHATTSSGTLTFTNCDETGKDGPSQSECNSEYSGTSLDGLVTVTSGIQSWTVTATATHTIEAYGAEGGGTYGGKGAKMSAEFSLTQGDVILILVGQQGSTSNPMSSGGGGTFVVKQTGSTYTLTTHSVYVEPLIIAGGGGGGGFSGNGTGGYSDGKSFLNGGTGGVRTSGSAPNIDGSFGGGGGARNNSGSFFGGGAGGGYSGGGGACGTSGTIERAGGGGSYSSSTTNTSHAAGNRSGHGQVIITW